jgi:uncharacterized protein YkwD
MDRDERRREVRESLQSRRRFNRVVAGMLGTLGLAICNAAVVAARNERTDKDKGNDKRKSNDKRKGDRDHNGSGGAPSGGDDGSSASLDAEESAFLTLLNDYRAANGREPFMHNGKLRAAAASHAQDMATNNFTGHIGSDGSAPAERIEDTGYDFDWSGENVFWGSADASVAFEWWKNSPEHDENMRWPHFTEIGISRAYNPASYYGWYWTTDFGNRLAK